MERLTKKHDKTPESDYRFRDLLAALTDHAWLAFSYTMSMILAVYAFGLYSFPSLLYVGIELPTFVAVVYILSRNPSFRFHAAFLWLLTALIAWSYLAKPGQDQLPYGHEILPVCVLAIFLYWLARATVYSKKEFFEIRSGSSLPYAIANLLSVWGAFLQVSVIVLVPLKHLAPEEMSQSIVGSALLDVLESIRLTSPLSWLPLGLILLGLSLYVILGLQHDPYRAKDYKDVLALGAPPVADLFLGAMRLPIWLVVVILEFLKHLLGLAWRNLRSHADIWVARFIVILFALALPFLAMTTGHVSIYKSMALVSQHSSASAFDLIEPQELLSAVAVHVLMLLALTAFVVSIAPIGMRVGSPILHDAGKRIFSYLNRDGFAAAQAVGKAFVLYALVILAVPVASLIPGGAGWGLFSTLYALLLVGLGFSYVLWDRLPEEQRQDRQRKLWELCRRFRPTLGEDKSGTAAQPDAQADG